MRRVKVRQPGRGRGTQGAVVISEDGRLLFAVNAGSNSISSFRIRPDGLELAATTPSGGTGPVSVAVTGGLLYALNAGMPNSVSGFTVGRHGELKPLAGSTQPLSAVATNPAQVGFSDDGEVLIVTERATNVIDTYTAGPNGLFSAPIVHPSAGPVPFGFAVNKRDSLIVLYVRVAALREIAVFRVASDGSLEALPSLTDTPDGLAGLAAF